MDFVRSDRVLVNDFENLPRDWEHSKWDGLEGIKFFRDKVEFFHLSLSEETWKVVNQKDSFRFEPAHVEVYDEAYFAGFVMGILKKSISKRKKRRLSDLLFFHEKCKNNHNKNTKK